MTFGGGVPGDIVSLLPNIPLHTNAVPMLMNKALSVEFDKNIFK